MASDLLDSLLGLQPGSAVHDVRHARAKVVDATQASHALFFDPQLPGLSLQERLLTAFYASSLTPNALLASHYRAQLQAEQVAPQALEALAEDALEAIGEPRLRAILDFTRALITAPVEGDKAALQRLAEAGLSTPEIVALAQLVAYLSYQVRLAAGLSALRGLADE